MKTIVILISGRGSNMEALIGAILTQKMPVKIAAVLSNRPEAKGLPIAQQNGIATRVIDHKTYQTRADFDCAMQKEIDSFSPDFVVLAGFMRILTDDFVQHYKGKMINIHPSLLPAFTGLNTHQRALEAGVKIHGCTVHFVTPTLDHGPIILQAAVRVLEDDTEEILAARVLKAEHQIFPEALRLLVTNQLRLKNGRVHIFNSEKNEQDFSLPTFADA